MAPNHDPSKQDQDQERPESEAGQSHSRPSRPSIAEPGQNLRAKSATGNGLHGRSGRMERPGFGFRFRRSGLGLARNKGAKPGRGAKRTQSPAPSGPGTPAP